ncbi:hypothetical protein CPB83DRAFT_763691 [Crepidotus variabilis]|uniref:Autophagy-related protein 11 n=1 Tax=Crepidotus variabilis TaxID=179855 RepID=A0A9P6EKH1_9AGAR|nr:hypothetical protein CPB83DRAFT_763691 [Crepidotus variabilis]
MITICRAEDGQVHQVNASLRDIETTGSLELFLHQEIGIDEDAALAYLSDGRRLTNANIRELGSAQDGFIFVFNRHHLDLDVEEALKLLHVEPVFQPSIEDVTATTPPIRHAQIAAAYARSSHKHHELIQHYTHSLSFQHQGLQIASKNLDFHVLAIAETFDGIASNAQRELEKQTTLLKGVDADLELISRVAVHVEFCSEAVRAAIEAGDPQRLLGDYVSKQKMHQVKETCLKTHDELARRFHDVDAAVRRLREGADNVRTTIASTSLLDEADACCRRSQDLLDRITDAAAALESPASNADALLQELKRLDDAQRQEVEQIVIKKNLYTHQCLSVLSHISTLNNELVYLPPALSAVSANFRVKTNFSHIQRLHTMLYAYGATVVEIVRRKEFTRFFLQRAQSILEVMAKFSASERKRRQVYRSELHGLLPFDTRGMDDPVPTIDFSPSGSTESYYSFERGDIDNLLQVMDELDAFARARLNSDPAALSAVGDCRATLEKLIGKMDNLETGFDKIAERSLLSQSRISMSRRRSIEAEERAIQELAEQLHDAQEAHIQQDHLFKEERSTFHREIHRLKGDLVEADSSLLVEKDRVVRLERELQQVRSQMESENVARRILEDRNGELSADISLQRKEIARALSDATDQAKEAEMLRQELARVRAEYEEMKQLEQRNADKVAHLLDEQTKTLRNLEEARARGEDLQIQIQAARAESEDVHKTLAEASQEKDRLLRAQASEHERIVRDHLAEADGDRAVLDRRFSEVQADLEHKSRELKEVRGDLEVAHADAVGLREELQRVERDLRDARQVERLLRDDLKAGRVSQHDFEARIENSSRLTAQILDVAINFRNTHAKALHQAQQLGSHPNAGRNVSVNLAESAFSVSGLRHSIIPQQMDEPSPIDPDDPSGALEILREFDHDHFVETVTKSIRKWQKQCKEYRERSKGKISFRNFTKGDLALFLPTRNSVSKPWAAFNVSFPHYFLRATGHLAEQLKSREWIVARITSITERVVDQKDPSSNPYGLGEGIKYYMLEVEDWTQPSHNKRRVSSKKVTIDGQDVKELGTTSPSSKLSPSALPPGPPEPEVEDTFMVTHPPNSHLFPSRARSNSSPAVRPSSLSRLLAQASSVPEGTNDYLPEKPPSTDLNTVPEIRNASATSTSSLPSPIPPETVANDNVIPTLPSPMRPASRASKVSSASRLPVGRKPSTLGTVAVSQPKAAPTTALTEQPLASSPSTTENNPFGSPITPSPEESISDAMSNALNNTTHHRRSRTTSYNVPRPSPLAVSSSQSTVIPPTRPSLTATATLATLASSWGMSFGRRKKAELAAGVLTPPVETLSDSISTGANGDRIRTASESTVRATPANTNSTTSALELLQRF